MKKIEGLKVDYLVADLGYFYARNTIRFRLLSSRGSRYHAPPKSERPASECAGVFYLAPSITGA
ncbi:hypothetical protein [Paenibacillus tianmuensis]|uniref:hypothetical protein n=1 Tax=Paenibacillus tianmuensis TaxID=624147 RepID=UPI001C26B48D